MGDMKSCAVLLNMKCLIITRTVIVLTRGEALIRRRLAPRVIIEEGVRLMISCSLTAFCRHFGLGIKMDWIMNCNEERRWIF